MTVYSQLNQSQTRQLLSGLNNTIGHISPFNNAALAAINFRINGNSPVHNALTQYDTVGVNSTLLSGNQIFVEESPGSSTISLVTNGAAAEVILNPAAAINFTDLGSQGDAGDVIVGSNTNGEKITVTQGANYVFAGSGANTIQGGTGADTLWGGGQSVLEGGTGNNQRLNGGFTTSAQDTLIGGSGTETLWVGYGNDSLQGGSGANTIYSGVSGDDTITGGGHSDIIGRGANELVNAGNTANAQDSVVAGPGFTTINTTAGSTDITTGAGDATINSGGSDSIHLTNGGYQDVTNTAGADTVYIGTTLGADTITGTSSAGVTVDVSQSLGAGTSYVGPGNSTIFVFSQGTSITYSGNVTIDHSSQNFS